MKFKRSIFVILSIVLCSCRITFVKNSSSSNSSSFSSINTSNNENISSSINDISSSLISSSNNTSSSSSSSSSSSLDNIKLYSKVLNNSVDVGEILTGVKDYQTTRNYWKVLKNRLNKEGSELVTNCNRLKLQSADGNFICKMF